MTDTLDTQAVEATLKSGDPWKMAAYVSPLMAELSSLRAEVSRLTGELERAKGALHGAHVEVDKAMTATRHGKPELFTLLREIERAILKGIEG